MSLNNTDFLDVADRILYEDNHIIVVNKQAGELCQGDQTGDVPLLEKVRDYIRQKYNKPGNVFCGLVHRIDRPVSGAVVFAKTSKGLSRMNEIVKKRDFAKYYWAIVEGMPEQKEQKLVHYLKKNAANNKTVVSAKEAEGWQRAELDYTVIASSDRYSLLEVKLMTGRHHQIRAQLSIIGNPIKGDLKYGAKRSEPDGSICLHSRRMEFVHPVSKKGLSIIADPFNNLFFKILQENKI